MRLNIVRSVARTYATHRQRRMSSAEYWQDRYSFGGTSGAGSYGSQAERKADFINAFVREHDIRSVIEFGCGDGNQLALAEYGDYLGFDVSPSAVELCKSKFAPDSNKQFRLLTEYASDSADLVLSLDVIYHLVEDRVFHQHLGLLFKAATRYVIIFSTNTNMQGLSPHVRHRKFTDSILGDGWLLLDEPPKSQRAAWTDRGEPLADFYVYGRAES